MTTEKETSVFEPVAVTLGWVSIVAAIIISGYGAMLFGTVGGVMAVKERSGRAIALNLIGFLLGFSAQLMTFFVARAG